MFTEQRAKTRFDIITVVMLNRQNSRWCDFVPMKRREDVIFSAFDVEGEIVRFSHGFQEVCQVNRLHRDGLLGRLPLCLVKIIGFVLFKAGELSDLSQNGVTTAASR